MEKSIPIYKYLENHNILCDGAFGTFYSSLYETDEIPELANITDIERVKCVHEEYLKAGAQLIRTNTFACNSFIFKDDNKRNQAIENAYNTAKDLVSAYSSLEKPRYVAADIGPISYENVLNKEDVQNEYVNIAKKFLSLGADIFVFETFTEFYDIQKAIEYIGDKAFIVVQFAVNQFGYSFAGLSANKLFKDAHECEYIDVIGLNCGVGPGHMHQIIKKAVDFPNKYISALPNAGYPQIISNRMIFSNKNIDYFVDKTMDMVKDGVRIIGGCCGTTPEYIRKMSEKLSLVPVSNIGISADTQDFIKKKVDNSFYKNSNLHGDKKLIAVELAPPFSCDDKSLMDAAHLLKACDVDVVTFPDSPSGRTRADSILMAEKVSRETGLCVMPHICCRDKNAIAIRSQLLGAYINKINNFLVITGDPIPSVMRSSVESVFNFDSVGLMNIINDMNHEIFNESSITFGGAINQGRRNFNIELSRVKKKIQAGATFFMSQPVFSQQDIDRLRQIKEETGARILYGIMPFVSLKNAMFMKNEMTGINVTDEVLKRYSADMTKQEGEAAGIQLAIDMINLTKDYADGYYFSFPFNRVHMLNEILKYMN